MPILRATSSEHGPLSTEPPSLAARLEQAKPLAWREAARIAARIARVLDRQHAQGKPHGGLEPLTVLFVGGSVRLADPLPPASRDPAYLAPRLVAGEPPDRASDFHALGCLLGEMVGPGDGLPPPIAAVRRRLLASASGTGYGSGNDIAAALELAIAASEGLAPPPPPQPPPAAPAPAASTAPPSDEDGHIGARDAGAAVAPPSTAGQLRRRKPARLVPVLVGLVVLAAAAILWLSVGDEPAIVAPEGADEAAPAERQAEAAPPADPQAPPSTVAESAPESSLEEVLAALPDEPLGDLEPPPEIAAQLTALLASMEQRTCTRLEVEPSITGVRLAGSTATAADRQAVLAEIAALDDVDNVTLEVDATSRFCQLYDLLGRMTTPSIPRLFDLLPKRSSYRLRAAEPLVVDALTPGFPSHLSVHYFAADGMVVHLTHGESEMPLHPPATALRIGDPADGHWLKIAEPFGRELIVALASEELLFAEPRPRIEPAVAYLEALEQALASQSRRPIAATMMIETVPASP